MIAIRSLSPRTYDTPAQRAHRSWTMRDGRRVVIRPIRSDDEELLAQFHAALSLETVYARYSQVLPLWVRTDHQRLAQRCVFDHDRELVLVAIEESPQPKIVAVARLAKMSDQAAEFAVVIADSHQHAGLGTRLLSRLIGFAGNHGLRRVIGYINADNTNMCAICRKLGFEVDWPTSGPTRTAVLTLPQKPSRNLRRPR